MEGGWEDEWARTIGLGRREVEEREEEEWALDGWMNGWMEWFHPKRAEVAWVGDNPSSRMHPFPPTDSPDFLPDAN